MIVEDQANPQPLGAEQSEGGGDPTQISVECVDTFEGVEALQPEWDDLFTRLQEPTLFQKYAWCAVWLATLGRGGHPLVLVARDPQKRIVGLAPLWSKRAGRGRELRIMGDYDGEYNGFLIDRDHPEALAGLLGWLVDHRRSWSRIVLALLLEDSAVHKATPPCFAAAGLHCRTYPFCDAPTCFLEDETDARKTGNKKTIRQRENKLRREHEIEFRHLLQEADDIVAFLDPFYELHIARWADTPTPSRFLDEESVAFFDRLVNDLAPLGHVMLSVLLADGRPIAFHLGLRMGDRLMSYCPCYDPAMAQYSPSMVLLRSIFENAWGLSLSEFDFAGGNESYKYRFSNHIRHIRELRAFSSRPAGWIDHFKQRLRIRLRESPRTRQFIKRLTKKLLA